jgi:hypothetical protein
MPGIMAGDWTDATHRGDIRQVRPRRAAPMLDGNWEKAEVRS